MRCHILTVLATLAATVVADVKFSSPVAGQQIAGGTAFTITWTDDGTTPTIDQFAGYTLNLMAGGNTAVERIPAGAATQPTAADMKRYLNRWKD
ncbi:unnamed protein product [Aureobasidium uvarum]|uniref:Yeast cell wall synthesis Kre9/Knh1-like N-terminal domain-containing protein n=1 Tax=Aureobasidium uvarum TaxID=2773716 RepID=A0A9N8KBV8_9PEZI|nr:unnamed protein product [Aureobasidium uvarum]